MAPPPPPSSRVTFVTALVAATALAAVGLRWPGAAAAGEVPERLAARLQWTGDPEVLEEANKELSNIIKEALEGGVEGEGALVRPAQLPAIYYHDEEHGVTVSTEGAAAAAARAWTVEQVAARLHRQHAEVALRVERLSAAGSFALDRRAEGDFAAHEEGPFSLELFNVTARGLIEVRSSGGRLRAGRIALDLHPADERWEASTARRSAALHAYTDGGALESGLRRRLRRDLSSLLEAAAKDRLRPALARSRIEQLLPSGQGAQRLRELESATSSTADGLQEMLLSAARRLLREEHADSLPLPDLREGFEHKVLMVTVTGNFWARDGAAHGLSSARRRGDALFAGEETDGGYTLWGTVAFDDLQLEYNHYEAKVMGLGPTGTLSAEVFPLAIGLRLRLDFDADRAVLENFNIEEVGDMTVELTGLGFPLNWLASRVATWLLAAYRDRVVDALQERFAERLADAMARTSLNELIAP